MDTELKTRVHNHWNRESCGESYALNSSGFDLEKQADDRYQLEPYIANFAKFSDGFAKDILEIGVGMGADHLLWARSKPKKLCGIDLTQRAIEFTAARLASQGLRSHLERADAEALPFPEESFDIVYSWGVMHHSPDTAKCLAEAARVLRRGGVARIMIYHKWSLVGLMLWSRYALLAGNPLRNINDIYFHHLESPGTKAFTTQTTRRMLTDAGFRDVTVRVQLSHGDLLQGNVGSRHGGALLSVATALWPRMILRRLFPHLGLYLLIDAVK